MITFLVRIQVLIVMALLTVLIGLSFGPVQSAIEGPLLDMLFSGEAARARLAELSSEQRYIHFLGTVINDTLYPLTYGALFGGLAGRFAPERWRGWVMLPAFLTVIVDFCENTVQALALSGTADILGLKSVLTPMKFGLFGLSLLLAVGFVIFAIVRWLTGRKPAG